MDLTKRALTFEAKSLDLGGRRVVRFTGSDETVDRYGTIIKVAGWKLDYYRKNNVFLWSHDTTLLPIGRTLDVRQEMGADGNRLAFDIDFADHPFAREVHKLYDGGFLHAVSVGFNPLKTRKPCEDEAKRHGPALKEVYEESELYELSAVCVPGNPNALIEHLSALDPEIRSIGADKLDEQRLSDSLERIRLSLEKGLSTRSLPKPEGAAEAPIETPAQPAPAPEPAPGERGAEGLDLDKPLTKRDFLKMVGAAETRVVDCFRGLAKRTEVYSLDLQLADFAKRLTAVEDGAHGAQPGTKGAPASYMDAALGERSVSKQLDRIVKHLANRK